MKNRIDKSEHEERDFTTDRRVAGMNREMFAQFLRGLERAEARAHPRLEFFRTAKAMIEPLVYREVRDVSTADIGFVAIMLNVCVPCFTDLPCIYGPYLQAMMAAAIEATEHVIACHTDIPVIYK